MKKFMKFWNMDETTLMILIIFILGLVATSGCSTLQHTYKGCDGKKKFKSKMSLR